jgi:hypothetical protein
MIPVHDDDDNNNNDARAVLNATSSPENAGLLGFSCGSARAGERKGEGENEGGSKTERYGMGDPDSFTSTPLCAALLGFGTDESASELMETCMICAERERERGRGREGRRVHRSICR